MKVFIASVYIHDSSRNCKTLTIYQFTPHSTICFTHVQKQSNDEINLSPAALGITYPTRESCKIENRRFSMNISIHEITNKTYNLHIHRLQYRFRTTRSTKSFAIDQYLAISSRVQVWHCVKYFNIFHGVKTFVILASTRFSLLNFSCFFFYIKYVQSCAFQNPGMMPQSQLPHKHQMRCAKILLTEKIVYLSKPCDPCAKMMLVRHLIQPIYFVRK